MQIYRENFDDWEDVCRNFNMEKDEPEYVFAEYNLPDYEGYANVYYLIGDQLYQVYGSHCSCYGLEGQWEPDETSYGALVRRREAQNNILLEAWLEALPDHLKVNTDA